MAENIRAAIAGSTTDARAMLIARTEMIGALNHGHIIQGRELEAEGMMVLKYWVNSGDTKVRPVHREMAAPGKSPVNGADGLFNVDGTMVPYPGHFSLEAAQRANCRCTVFTDISAIGDDTLEPELEPEFEE
mgnify:CR=1 FL=1